MGVQIQQIGPEGLEQYGLIPIRYQVDSVLRVQGIEGGLGGLRLIEEAVERPYSKDYDAYRGQGPTRWPKRYNVSNWAFFLACDGSHAVGGATVAYRTPEVHMLDGRDDLAILWDLRVDPQRRREGIGTMLFDRAIDWACAKGCRQFRAETQNINVTACRFYSARGCRLGCIHRYGYAGDPHVADETMLLWYLDLSM